MFDSTRFLLFLTAAVLLAIAPGPGMLYVLARSLAGGKREGVLSALGTFLGRHGACVGGGAGSVDHPGEVRGRVRHGEICRRGLSVLSGRADDSGRSQRESKRRMDIPQLAKPARNPLWQGVATEVLNPKTALFFLSFIPQFVNRGARTRLPAVRGAGNDLSGDEH